MAYRKRDFKAAAKRMLKDYQEGTRQYFVASIGLQIAEELDGLQKALSLCAEAKKAISKAKKEQMKNGKN